VTTYPEPVGALQRAGEVPLVTYLEWTDYPVRYGLTTEHVPLLIDMACNMELHRTDVTRKDVWGPVHAWSALGQLRAESAIDPLLRLALRLDDDDFLGTELPDVLGTIGPAAIEPVTAFIADHATRAFAVGLGVDSLKEIGSRHPETRDDCVRRIVALLGSDAPTDKKGKGFAVGALLDLKAVESIDAMRDAFNRGAVEIGIAGDLEDAEIDLGLRVKRVSPKPNYQSAMELPVFPPRDRLAAPTPKLAKVGRNDPCPCGSGKKYKKCCGA
jgi:hypothetical protein